MLPEFDLVIPLYNEAANLPALVAALAESPLLGDGLRRVILVENGSRDDTRTHVRTAAARHRWIETVELDENLQYGGGLLAGFARAEAPNVGYLPGDGQVHIGDLARLWAATRTHPAFTRGEPVFAKGWRRARHDPPAMRRASYVYTALANALLGLRVRDVNGLPKIFPRHLLDHLPAERMQTFTLDAQLLQTARRLGWPIHEIPVTFHARRAGVSSWSKKRRAVYWQTLLQIWRLRSLPSVGKLAQTSAP